MNAIRGLWLGATFVVAMGSVACAQDEPPRFQYIQLFSGPFPLPLESELIAWSSDTLEYSYPGPVHEDQAAEGSEADQLPIGGTIRIGARSAVESLLNADSKPVLLAHCGELEVWKTAPANWAQLRQRHENFPDLVVIVDRAQYLSILSYRVETWRDMLREYERLVGMPNRSCAM